MVFNDPYAYAAAQFSRSQHLVRLADGAVPFYRSSGQIRGYVTCGVDALVDAGLMMEEAPSGRLVLTADGREAFAAVPQHLAAAGRRLASRLMIHP